jgi:hypothetical protein
MGFNSAFKGLSKVHIILFGDEYRDITVAHRLRLEDHVFESRKMQNIFDFCKTSKLAVLQPNLLFGG